MLHAFNIYPALLVLTPVKTQETPITQEKERENSWCEDDRHFPSCPQTYWGNCVSNDHHTQLMFSNGMDAEVCPIQKTINGKWNVLEPKKFKGKHYTITYIQVLN
jgi:hypothetical protein